MSFEKTQFNEQILKHTQTNDCQTMMVGELAMVLLGNQACKKGTCIQRRPWVEDLILERQESWPAFQDQMFGYTVVALVMFFHHFLLRIQLISLWSTFHRWIFYFLDFTHTHTHPHTHTDDIFLCRVGIVGVHVLHHIGLRSNSLVRHEQEKRISCLAKYFQKIRHEQEKRIWGSWLSLMP